jgi:hypothetical protein
MRRPNNSPLDWTWMQLEKIPGKTAVFIFLYFGWVTIGEATHKTEGRYSCLQECKGVYLWPDNQRGAKVLVIYT